MAYEEALAELLRNHLSGEGVTEKKAFGGICFMVEGKMAIAASGQGGALVRIDPEEAETLCARPGVERMVMRGKAMDGWLRVESSEFEDKAVLAEWIARGVASAERAAEKD